MEVVALTDVGGRCIGAAPRDLMRRDNLRHGATAVLVRDREGRFLVGLRSPTKDWCPDHYEVGAGGVLGFGEDPTESARRELAEELGIVGVDLRPLGVVAYADATVRCVEHCFEVVYDGPLTYPDGEIVETQWLTLPELALLLRDEAWPLIPDCRAVLSVLALQGVGDYGALRAP